MTQGYLIKRVSDDKWLQEPNTNNYYFHFVDNIDNAWFIKHRPDAEAVIRFYWLINPHVKLGSVILVDAHVQTVQKVVLGSPK